MVEVRAKIVFPDSHDTQSCCSQVAGDPAITISIPSDFCPPELNIRLGNVSATRAAMPETSVNENCEPGLHKVKIRLTYYISWGEPPSANARLHKCCAKPGLSRLIAAPPNRTHLSRAFLADINKPAARQFVPKESFHSSNAFVVKSGQGGREPEKFGVGKRVCNPRRKTLSRKPQVR